MRFLTSLSQSIYSNRSKGQRDGESLPAKGPWDREGEGRHNRRMEEDIGCPWQQKREIYLVSLNVVGGCHAGAIWQREGGTPHPFSRGSTGGFLARSNPVNPTLSFPLFKRIRHPLWDVSSFSRGPVSAAQMRMSNVCFNLINSSPLEQTLENNMIKCKCAMSESSGMFVRECVSAE